MAYDLIKISGLPLVTPDSGQDIVVGVGDYAKRINYNAVKADMVGTSPSYTTDTEPYLMRRTAHTGVVGKCALNKLVGGSLGWNQLCNGSSVTVPNGHKYYMKKSGTASIGASTGSALTGLTSGTDMVIDLTVMFGLTIADYIYGLESATAGAGVAWLSKYIDISKYYAYDAGSIQSVQATAHVTTGFNQWNEVWESGYYDADGSKGANSTYIRSKDLIRALPNTAYCYRKSSTYPIYICEYDGNGVGLGRTGYSTASTTGTFTTKANTAFLSFCVGGTSTPVTSYGNDICINISKTSGTPKNGDYVPYNGHTYPLGSDTLRGYPMLVNNKLAFDGDEKYPDGTTKRRYGIVDLGSLNWTAETSTVTGLFRCTSTISGLKYIGLLMCARYLGVQKEHYNSMEDGDISVTNSAALPYLRIRDVSKNSMTGDQFKTAMNGVYLVYELATPTTETADPYQRIQTIDKDGTEQFVCSSPVPVGHYTQTADNVLAALGWLGE